MSRFVMLMAIDKTPHVINTDHVQTAFCPEKTEYTNPLGPITRLVFDNHHLDVAIDLEELGLLLGGERWGC